MPRLWTRTPPTIQPQSARKTPALLGLLAFGLTAAAVYGWGYSSRTAPPTKPTYTATAYVVEQSHKATTGELRIPLAYTDDDPLRAEDVANALAETYVEDRSAEWNRRTQGPYLKAHEAAEAARLEVAQNEARVEAFRAEMAEQLAKSQAAAQRKEKPSPTMIDNPEWSDVNRQLVNLTRRRESLLTDRTPLHPSVQEVTTRIDDLKRQMAAIPRQIPGKAPALAKNGSEAGSQSLAERDSRGERELNQLTAALETARRTCQEAEAVEKRTVEQQKAGPDYAVAYARAVEVPPEAEYNWRQLAWTSLLAAVLMAFGVGAVSIGAGIDPPVGNAAEVQGFALAPVIGLIPAEDPIPDPTTISRRLSHARHSLIAAGLILMAASPAAAVWGVMGG